MFNLFKIQCGVYPCLLIVLAWAGFSPYMRVGGHVLVLCFVLFYVICMYAGSCTGRVCHFYY